MLSHQHQAVNKKLHSNDLDSIQIYCFAFELFAYNLHFFMYMFNKKQETKQTTKINEQTQLPNKTKAKITKQIGRNKLRMNKYLLNTEMPLGFQIRVG